MFDARHVFGLARRQQKAARFLGMLAFWGLSVVLVAGCSTNGSSSSEGSGTSSSKDEISFRRGAHKGILVPVGATPNKDYNFELLVDHNTGETTVWILDGSGKTAPKVDPEKCSVSVSFEKPDTTLTLKHEPKKSGEEGIAFTGTDNALAKEGLFEGVLQATIIAKGAYSQKAHFAERKD